jgi:DNA-binding MarR family transcriptional regulator
MSKRPAPQEGPDFKQLRYFKEDGWLGFGLEVWGTYFSAPLYAEMYKRFEILPDEFSVLASLYDCGSLSAKTICAITGRPKNSVSRGVTRLLASGRIKRTINPNDRREAFLSLLAEGRKLYERILPLCRERERALLAGLTTAELVALDTLMMKLMLFYHQSPEGVGLSNLKQLGIPSEIQPD